MNEPRSPKRAQGTVTTDWYNYYAGYSKLFVQDALDLMDLKASSVVYDPWNGSGTTTKVACENGMTAIGIDINPVMVVVGRARLLPVQAKREITATQDLLLTQLRCTGTSVQVLDTDPLNTWFSPRSAGLIRFAWEWITSHSGNSLASSPSHRAVSLPHHLSFLSVSLFSTVRHAVGSFQSSNPTWLVAPSETEKVDINIDEFIDVLSASIAQQYDRLCEDWDSRSQVGTTTLSLGSSERFVPERPVDAVITSPPYLTRLDYAKATATELAVMGLSPKDVRGLRDSMIGTPTIQKRSIVESPAWGETCLGTLASVKGHSSKASPTYYYKTFIQYFSGLWESMSRMTEAANPGCQAAIVVQDSYYKDVHVDLPAIVVEMAQGLGWSLSNKYDYKVSRNMSSVHPGNQKYRKGRNPATEVAVFLEKTS